MSDLSLNQRGIHFVINQARVAEFMTTFAEKEGIELDLGKDKYLAPVLINGQILEKLCDLVKVEVEDVETVENFELFMETTKVENIRPFESCSGALFGAASKVDDTFTEVPDFKSYEKYINQMAKILEILQEIDGVPEVDFNSDEYLLNYVPSDAEIKIAINLIGTDVIFIENNNTVLDKEPNAFSNNLWAMYIVAAVATIALQIIVKNLEYYAEFIGATPSQTANLTTYFNLVELFFSVFWLWLSDIIGRKPIYVITLGIYAIIAGVLTQVPKESGYAEEIAMMQGLRAAMGVGAITAPIAFVIGADLAPPKNRGLVTVMVNVSTELGSILASLITIWFGSGKNYDTRNFVSGDPEYNERSIRSYVDSHFWSMGFYILSIILCVVLLKESHPRIIALKKLKKMGITPPKTKETNAEPIWRVFLQMCKNRDIMLLFFAYWINLIGATNSRTGAQVFITKMYAFTDVNYAKSYSNVAQVVCILISIVVSVFCTKPFIKWFGEVRLIIFSEFTSILESIINLSIDMPLPKGILYVTLTLTSMTLIFCDAIFLQLVSMYTTPQNRGQVLGIFEIGNSVGRTLSGVVTGVMYDYNIREAEAFNTIFASACLLLLAMVRPPLERTEMDAAAAKMKAQKISENKI